MDRGNWVEAEIVKRNGELGIEFRGRFYTHTNKEKKTLYRILDVDNGISILRHVAFPHPFEKREVVCSRAMTELLPITEL